MLDKSHLSLAFGMHRTFAYTCILKLFLLEGTEGVEGFDAKKGERNKVRKV